MITRYVLTGWQRLAVAAALLATFALMTAWTVLMVTFDRTSLLHPLLAPAILLVPAPLVILKLAWRRFRYRAVRIPRGNTRVMARRG